jgi:hypothetical protein
LTRSAQHTLSLPAREPAGRKALIPIGTDAAGRRIGVELGEWLNEEQRRDGKRQERVEDSFLAAIRSEDESPPENVGCVWLSLTHDSKLPVEEAEQFRAEILECILASLHLRSARQIPACKGIAWVGFPPKGSAYTPKSAVHALLKLLVKKTKKDADLHPAVNLDQSSCTSSLTGIRA